MTQTQLSYAQKVKGNNDKGAGGGGGGGGQQQPNNPQYRMIPTGPNILQPQTSNINIQASTLQNYAYPYNYTNLQQQQLQQVNRNNAAYQQQSNRNNQQYNNQYQQQRHSQQRGQYGQRDFFD